MYQNGYKYCKENKFWAGTATSVVASYFDYSTAMHTGQIYFILACCNVNPSPLFQATLIEKQNQKPITANRNMG